MDGHFVPVITFGPIAVEAVKKSVTIPLDVHLMISEPIKHIKAFRDAGADIITVHVESNNPLDELIQAIRESGARVGVTVNPDRSAGPIIEHLDKIDHVLIMSVFPGYSGQKFLENTMSKVRAVYDAARALQRSIDIQVDGGINNETAVICGRYGANVFVAGNYIYKSNDYAARIRSVREGAAAGRKELIDQLP
jgi:ribulose-phosphate 3-epimerase